MKKTNIILTSFITVLVLAIASITIATATNAINWNFSMKNIFPSGPAELIQSESFDDTTITSLDLETISTTITFSESSDTSIHINYYAARDEDKLEIKQSGNTVTLREPHKYSIGINFRFTESRVEIAIPKRQYASIKVATTSAPISLKNVQSNRVSLSSISGRLEGASIQSDSLIASTTSGSIQLNTITGDVRSDSISGSIKATNLTGSIQSGTTSGSITVEGFNMLASSSFSSISGSVTLTGLHTETVPSAELSSLSGKITSSIAYNGAKLPLHISAETTSGRITIGD